MDFVLTPSQTQLKATTCSACANQAKFTGSLAMRDPILQNQSACKSKSRNLFCNLKRTEYKYTSPFLTISSILAFSMNI